MSFDKKGGHGDDSFDLWSLLDWRAEIEDEKEMCEVAGGGKSLARLDLGVPCLDEVGSKQTKSSSSPEYLIEAFGLVVLQDRFDVVLCASCFIRGEGQALVRLCGSDCLVDDLPFGS